MRTGSLTELSAVPGMPSKTTLRAFIRNRPDFPVILFGNRGAGYVFNLEVAAAFVRANWRDKRSDRVGAAKAGKDKDVAKVAPQPCGLLEIFSAYDQDSAKP